MNILALETSGPFCSVALLRGEALFSQHQEAPRRHGELLLPMMDQILAQGEVGLTDLDAIAFGRGPGSFTGVRIAAAVAQGVAFGAGVPVVAVSSLAALAHAGWRLHRRSIILTAMDARIGELYWGVFQVAGERLVRELQAEAVSAPGQVKLVAESWPELGGREARPELDLGVGNGWEVYKDILKDRTRLGDDRIHADVVCSAADVAALAAVAVASGDVVAPELGLPVYLREQVAIKQMSATRRIFGQ